jgi:urocanate hydratase
VSRVQKRRLETRYVDVLCTTLDDALAKVRGACAEKRALSIGLVANAADVYPELVRRGVIPDFVTEQTSAHDPLRGYIPSGLTMDEAASLRERDPETYVRRARESMAAEVRAMREMQRRGAFACDYGNNIRAEAKQAGVEDAFEIAGVRTRVRASPVFCVGKGPFRWVALSGDPEDIAVTDRAVLEAVLG